MNQTEAVKPKQKKSKRRSIADLRRNGWKIGVRHERNFDPFFIDEKNPEGVMPYGGCTTVRVTSPGGLSATGEACCSINDNYNKKLGVDIALGRAMKKICGRRQIKEMKRIGFSQALIEQVLEPKASMAEEMPDLIGTDMVDNAETRGM